MIAIIVLDLFSISCSELSRILNARLFYSIFLDFLLFSEKNVMGHGTMCILLWIWMVSLCLCISVVEILGIDIVLLIDIRYSIRFCITNEKNACLGCFL